MIQCENCGQSNTVESKFCRFCGLKFQAAQPVGADYDYPAPRPYAWKTDEYQTQSEPRRTRQNQQIGKHPGQPLAYQSPAYLVGNYRCPNCGSNYLPVIEQRISTTGWIVFALLLVFTFVFFWIGLLIREDVSVCPVCRTKVN